MYCGAMSLSALNIRRSILWEIRCLTGNQWRFPGGGLPHKKGGDARWKISIEPLKGTNLGVA